MAHRIQLAVLGAVLFVGACGLDVVGIGPDARPDASAAIDGGGSEGSTIGDAGPPPPPADCSNGSCPDLALEAPGFTTIAFGEGTEVCPQGFDSAAAIADPVARDGSCACGPCTTTGSTCSTGSIPTSQSDDNRCNFGGVAFNANNGQCVASTTYWGSAYGGVGVPNPKVGTCKAAGTGVRQNVDATAKRVCTPRAGTCPAAMCSLPGKLEVCLLAPNEVDCPAVAPERHVIGRDVKMTCGDCSCVPAATCGGNLRWWEVSSSCNGPESGTVPANVCTKVNGKDIGSYRWDGVVASETCLSVKPVAKATVALDGIQTVCCPQR